MKFILILLIVLPVLFFLNTGFSDSSWLVRVQTIAFALVFSMILVWPQIRKFILWTAGFLIMAMAALFITGRIENAELFGSSGFGLVILILIAYLPQFIKKGYVEKI